jgi:hypothetical protein
LDDLYVELCSIRRTSVEYLARLDELAAEAKRREYFFLPPRYADARAAASSSPSPAVLVDYDVLRWPSATAAVRDLLSAQHAVDVPLPSSGAAVARHGQRAASSAARELLSAQHAVNVQLPAAGAAAVANHCQPAAAQGFLVVAASTAFVVVVHVRPDRSVGRERLCACTVAVTAAARVAVVVLLSGRLDLMPNRNISAEYSSSFPQLQQVCPSSSTTRLPYLPGASFSLGSGYNAPSSSQPQHQHIRPS